MYDVKLNTEDRDENKNHIVASVFMTNVPTIEDARMLAYMALRWEQMKDGVHCSRCGIYDPSIIPERYDRNRIGEVVIWYDHTARYYDNQDHKYILNRDGTLGEQER